MRTKVLLMTDVENLGRVGDVVEVAGGYARNYLLPRGLAAAPTAEAMRAATKERERLEKERQERLAALKKVADRMAGKAITLSAAANEEGHLYGSVSARDIVTRLAEVGYPDLQPSQVRMEHALPRGRRARCDHAPRRRHRRRDQGHRGQERRTGDRSRRKSPKRMMRPPMRTAHAKPVKMVRPRRPTGNPLPPAAPAGPTASRLTISRPR